MSQNLFSLKDKVAVVTGASRGIGRAIALGFAAAGADVAVAARSEGDLDTLAKEIDGLGRRAIAVPVDVTEREQLENLFDRCLAELGRLDVAVNNAGGSNFASPLLSLRPEGWDKVLALNLDSVFHATQLAAERMVDRGGGSIIQMSSVAGLQGAETLSFYSAAKAGVRLMTQAVARELAASGVRVNSLAPGWVATDLNAGMWRDDATRSEMESRIPMGRLGLADEIVGPAIFLASDASSFVTGTTLVVDGGQLA